MIDNMASQHHVPLESVEAIRNEITDLFEVFDTTLDEPRKGQMRYRGRFYQDPADCYDELRKRFERHGFTPLVRREGERIALIGMPVVFNPPKSRWSINLVLFIATIFSTLLVGAIQEVPVGGEFVLWRGWPFSLSILLILGAHELGHYFAARYHKVAVTLPYFLPLPTLLGTLGAFIQLKEPVKNRRVLLDVGVAGPLAGMVFAVPILLYGLATSEIGPITPGGLLEGNSILYALAKILVLGQFYPADGYDVYVNSVAWAGWAGLLVTGLNLFPVGQLDGGHVAYVLFGRRARQFYWPVIIGLITLSIVGQTSTWILWTVLLYFFGRYHAEPLDDVTELDGGRRIIAICMLILFVLVFVPVPLQTIG